MAGGWLLQGSDDITGEDVEFKVVTEREPSELEMADVRFAWLCVKHVKSNAITIAKVRNRGGTGRGNRVQCGKEHRGVQALWWTGFGFEMAFFIRVVWM